jgi:hypothetical protein
MDHRFRAGDAFEETVEKLSRQGALDRVPWAAIIAIAAVAYLLVRVL